MLMNKKNLIGTGLVGLGIAFTILAYKNPVPWKDFLKGSLPILNEILVRELLNSMAKEGSTECIFYLCNTISMIC